MVRGQKKRKRNEGTIESVEMIKYCGGDPMWWIMWKAPSFVSNF